jgi:hypothetical protein
MLVPARLDPIEFVTDAQCALRTRVHFGVQVFQQTGRGIEDHNLAVRRLSIATWAS